MALLMAAVPATAESPTAWRGALSLGFAPIAGRTVVAERRHEGPFLIQRPFYPDDGTCHVYLLHPPGGLTAGDTLELDAHAAAGSRVLLTTPAATKIYRAPSCAAAHAAGTVPPDGGNGSSGDPRPAERRSSIRQSLHAAAGATLEWLPLETILFGGSRAALHTHVHLDADARFVGWEMTALGRPLSGDPYAEGELEQRTRIEIGGRPALDERAKLHARDQVLHAPYGFAGHRAWGALYAYPADRPALDAARRALRRLSRAGVAAATLLGALLVVRCLARRAETLRAVLETSWAQLREPLIGARASAPRIWHT